ncbi:DUF6440 family protein [Tetragenococcus halophilus]|uniref:DUF6440 family protein n=1 Tax=Tetragenococcus halophilus TaxID=51669 RepID=UPI001F170CA4|nr:DUF6440 family protein [Tetragenococcus halophilus]MCF1684948.1 DUF6440 family protein [Tetragenococcus halophilus]
MAEKRFEEIYTQGKLKAEKIVRDNKTGVLYLVYEEGYGVGITVLFDKDGKPLVDEDFLK